MSQQPELKPAQPRPKTGSTACSTSWTSFDHRRITALEPPGWCVAESLSYVRLTAICTIFSCTATYFERIARTDNSPGSAFARSSSHIRGDTSTAAVTQLDSSDESTTRWGGAAVSNGPDSGLHPGAPPPLGTDAVVHGPPSKRLWPQQINR